MAEWPGLPKRIQTERLTLRRFRFDDAPEIHRYSSDKEFAWFLDGVPGDYSPVSAERWVASAQLLDWPREPHWALEYEGRPIGGVGLRMNPEHCRAALSYETSREHWGKGLTTEACRAAIDAAFRDLPELNRVFAYADPRNVASTRVMEKLGMRYEATLRQHRIHRGKPIDDAYYGVLRDEWESARR